MNTKIIYLVSFVAFMGPFTQSIYAPLLTEIQQHYHTNEYMINASISIFTLFLAIMQVVYGPLADQRGRRFILLPGIVIYIVASIGIASANSIHLLLIFRALQAVGIAAGSVVATMVISDLYEGKNRGKAMGIFQMLVALGPAVGPAVGGFVGQYYGFKWVFWILVILGCLIGIINFFMLPETKKESGAKEGFQLSNISQVILNRTGSVVIFLGFVQYFSFYQYLIFLPKILHSTYQLTSSQSGYVFLTLSLFVVIGSIIGGRIQARYEHRKVLLGSTLLNILSIFLFVAIYDISLYFLMLSIAIFGLCLGISLPIQTTILVNQFDKNRGTAVGVYNFLRYLGMAAGPIAGTYFAHLGNNMEFIFSGIIFLLVFLYSVLQFTFVWREKVNSQ